MNAERILKTIKILKESAKQHKRSSSMHRQQGRRCLQEAAELQNLLSTEKGGDK